jgi:hypothetical protein
MSPADVSTALCSSYSIFEGHVTHVRPSQPILQDCPVRGAALIQYGHTVANGRIQYGLSVLQFVLFVLVSRLANGRIQYWAVSVLGRSVVVYYGPRASRCPLLSKSMIPQINDSSNK